MVEDRLVGLFQAWQCADITKLTLECLSEFGMI